MTTTITIVVTVSIVITITIAVVAISTVAIVTIMTSIATFVVVVARKLYTMNESYVFGRGMGLHTYVRELVILSTVQRVGMREGGMERGR